MGIRIKHFDFKEFFDFIGQQGVLGLAIGFVLGASVSKVVASFVEDIVNPLLGVILGATGAITDAKLVIGEVTVSWGHFVATVIDFLVIALVIFYVAKWLKLGNVIKKD